MTLSQVLPEGKVMMRKIFMVIVMVQHCRNALEENWSMYEVKNN